MGTITSNPAGAVFLNIKQAAAFCNVSVKTIRRAVWRGLLRKANNGVRKILIHIDELLRWMADGSTGWRL